MLCGGKRVAYTRIPSQHIAYSLVEEERGKDSGRMQTVFLRVSFWQPVMQAYLGGGGGFGGESCFTTCVMPCPSSLPLLLRKIRESYRVEWQPPSQGSLLPVLGTRLNGVGVRATDRRNRSPRLSPRPLGLAPTPPRFGIQQKRVYLNREKKIPAMQG